VEAMPPAEPPIPSWSSWSRRLPHLAALGVALVFVALILTAGIIVAQVLERRHIYQLSSQIFGEKNKGLVLQKLAFEQPNLLPFYGSSELIKQVAGKPGDFFQAHPDGFQVFEVGRSGAACLSIVEKLGAVGAGLRGKKVVISISPMFFFQRRIAERFFTNNFSQLQAEEVIFSGNLSYPLRRDIARQILTHPATFKGDDILTFGLERLAGNSALDRALYTASIPLGRLEVAILSLQDHFHAAIHIRTERHHLEPFAERPAQPIPWNSLFAEANAETKPVICPDHRQPHAGMDPF
jgi:D-alanine transfer protein